MDLQTKMTQLLIGFKYNIIDGHYDEMDGAEKVSPHIKPHLRSFASFTEGDEEMLQI